MNIPITGLPGVGTIKSATPRQILAHTGHLPPPPTPPAPIAASFLQPTDGSETTTPLVPNRWGIKVPDQNAPNPDVFEDQPLLPGHLKPPNIATSPPDTSLITYVKAA